MYQCTNGNKILNDLPVWDGGINHGKVKYNAMVGMILSLEVDGVIYDGIRIVEIVKSKTKNSKFIVEYNGEIYSNGIFCNSFLGGNFKKILKIKNESKNSFEIVGDTVYISRSDSDWIAMYSGNFVDLVVKATWNVSLDSKGNALYLYSNNYNNTMTTQYLHKVDFQNLENTVVVDHINNNRLDNRLVNLRVVTKLDNSKNKICNNEFGLVGIRKNGNGWSSTFAHKNNHVCTKTRNSLHEAMIDNLIAQRYLGYKHNEDMFYVLKELSIDRIKEVEVLIENKLVKYRNKKHKIKEYNNNIIECDGYYKLIKNNNEMLFDNTININQFCIYPYNYNNKTYWLIRYIEDNKIIMSRFHRFVLNMLPLEYNEYNIHVDHLNGDSNDNRRANLAIATSYSNQCNIKGVGYIYSDKNMLYTVICMNNYKYWQLIGGIRFPSFKTEQEAINEVNRRKEIIDNARVKLKSKEELDELIKYCLDNKYILKSGLADLDLGYLYLKGIY